ncbi:MAG: BatD family protein [Candidatus Aureabacteria bacterium]|nr:BatD family protein [Candidatus Auribacterota bacterium]
MTCRRARIPATAICASVALLLFSVSSSAEGLRGALGVDTLRATVGETVLLTLTLSGEGEAGAFRIQPPALPALGHFALVETGQRNEVSWKGGKELFSVACTYTLRATSPGDESIGTIQVVYEQKGKDGSNTLAVDGVRITAVPRTAPRVIVSALGLLVLFCIVALVVLLRGIARRKREAAKLVLPSMAVADPAVAALARIENSRRLKVEGNWGAYGAEVAAALAGYLTASPVPEMEALQGEIEPLCERVRYASDRDAEHRIEECTRKAELFFKTKIKETFK